jgi:sugar-specific transcriptional regulator TrmB
MVVAIPFDESIKVLGDLGLSGTLARTYQALLGLGESTVRELANVSKVARPDSYRALIALYEQGLVEKIVAVPTRFKPLSLIDAVNILVQRRTRENIDLYEKAV